MSILGQYDKIEVHAGTVFHGGQEKPISWLNPHVFHLRWDTGNDQLWIFNDAKKTIFQIVNKLGADLPKSSGNKLKSQSTFTAPGVSVPPQQLGNFNGTIIAENYIHHFGQEKSIVWINPHALYFKWDKGNEQVWIYDVSTDAYLQLVMSEGGVKAVADKDANRMHKRV